MKCFQFFNKSLDLTIKNYNREINDINCQQKHVVYEFVVNNTSDWQVTLGRESRKAYFNTIYLLHKDTSLS